MNLDPEVSIKILELTNQKLYAQKDNIYKETLRQLLNIFSNLYYTDGNNKLIKIKCTSGKQERAISKKDSSLILPYITVTESDTTNADYRRRYSPVLVHEKVWNKAENRAQRVLSLAPRAVDLYYNINVWTKFAEDMDMIRISIFSLFNPDLVIRTSFSDLTRGFLESESTTGETEALDTADRVLKKSFMVKVETYIPSPKFLYTNTGQIQEFLYDVDIYSGGCD